MILVIGEICDVASGIISAAKGDWVGVGLSLSSAVPIFGNLSGGAKIARNVIKIVDKADDIADVTKVVNKGEDFIGSYKEARAAIKASVEKGLEVHHVIEKRFIRPLGFNADNMPCIALKKSDHHTFASILLTYIFICKG